MSRPYADPTRPPRTYMPAAVKRAVRRRQGDKCTCGCGRDIGRGFIYDHHPQLAVREVNADGTDYIPPQNDPAYIVARCRDSDAPKTSRDASNRGKVRRLRGENKPKPKRVWPAQRMKSAKRPWPKRRMSWKSKK